MPGDATSTPTTCTSTPSRPDRQVPQRRVYNYRRRVRLLRERVPDDPGDLCCAKHLHDDPEHLRKCCTTTTVAEDLCTTTAAEGRRVNTHIVYLTKFDDDL